MLVDDSSYGTTGAEEFLENRVPAVHVAGDLWDLRQWLGLD